MVYFLFHRYPPQPAADQQSGGERGSWEKSLWICFQAGSAQSHDKFSLLRATFGHWNLIHDGKLKMQKVKSGPICTARCLQEVTWQVDNNSVGFFLTHISRLFTRRLKVLIGSINIFFWSLQKGWFIYVHIASAHFTAPYWIIKQTHNRSMYMATKWALPTVPHRQESRC